MTRTVNYSTIKVKLVQSHYTTSLPRAPPVHGTSVSFPNRSILTPRRHLSFPFSPHLGEIRTSPSARAHQGPQLSTCRRTLVCHLPRTERSPASALGRRPRVRPRPTLSRGARTDCARGPWGCVIFGSGAYGRLPGKRTIMLSSSEGEGSSTYIRAVAHVVGVHARPGPRARDSEVCAPGARWAHLPRLRNSLLR
jgi:hypothetical protein